MTENPSPVTGLNFLESEDSLPPTDARVLDNWIPDAGYCRVRESGTEITDITSALP